VRRAVPGAVAGLTGPLALLVLLLVSGSGSSVASTAGGTVRIADRADSAAALRLLARAATAGDRVSYRGVQFVSAWSAAGSTSVVVHVDHQAGRGTAVHTDATAQTPAKDTFLPAATSTMSIAGTTAGLALLEHNFAVVLAGRGWVAGREVDVVKALRAGDRPAATFWLDRATGLVLRREVYDGHGRATRASAFVDLQVRGDAAASQAPATPAIPPREVHAWRDALDGKQLAAMRGHGWPCPVRLPQALQLVDARRGGGDFQGIVHLSYSDGLATVSVFLQRGRLDVARLADSHRATMGGRAVYVRDGVPMRVTWSSQGTVYTVVADAPTRTVDQVVAAFPYQDGAGTMGRLGRGLDRVASWFNPFG
jgi:negative regulator of sigma E activity